MRKTGLTVLVFLIVQGIILRIIDYLTTPIYQHFYKLAVLSISNIFYIRIILQILLSISMLIVFIILCKRKFDFHCLLRISILVAIYSTLIIVISKTQNDSLSIDFWLWLLNLPIEGYMSLTYLISGTYTLSAIHPILFLPAILGPFSLLLLSKESDKKQKR